MQKIVLQATTAITNGLNTSAINMKYCEKGAVSCTITSASAPSGASIKLQGSNDNSNWADISGASANITADGEIIINLTDVGYKFVRGQFAISSGSANAKVVGTGKERRV